MNDRTEPDASLRRETEGDAHLFAPLTLRGTTFPNRVVLSPMCQYMAFEGMVQDWHFAHHARYSLGGLGAAMVEATGVTRNGRITHGCTGIWSDAHIAGFRRIVDLYHARDIPCGIQIGHSGRRGSALRPWDGASPIKTRVGPEPAWQPVGPSPLPERPGYPVPHALTVEEVAALRKAFVDAALRAVAAGFDFIEIHGAHGYLLHSFVSPVSNQRTDDYGGALERRIRFPVEVARAVRAEVPSEMPLLYRASCVDGVEAGHAIEDTIELAKALKASGIDMIDCSSGGMSGAATLSTNKVAPGYQVPYAEAIRRDAAIPTMAVGAIIEASQADGIVRSGRADMVAIARELMADPAWVYRAAQVLEIEAPHAVLPPQYAFYLERRDAVLDRDAKPN